MITNITLINTFTFRWQRQIGIRDREKNLPPGTDSYPLELAPSGHLLLPCSNFADLPPNSAPIMTLLTNQVTSKEPVTVKPEVTDNVGTQNVTAAHESAAPQRESLSAASPVLSQPLTPPPKLPPAIPVYPSQVYPEAPSGVPI